MRMSLHDSGKLWMIVGMAVFLVGLALGAHQAYELYSNEGISPRYVIVIGLSTAIVPCGIGLLLSAVGHLTMTWGRHN